MTRARACALSIALAVASMSSAAQTSPYVDEAKQEIKALSPAEVQSLLAGRGMGLAKAAELNGYPGPAHVLELADALELTAQQRAQSEAIHAHMEASAKTLGGEIIAAERKLDGLFRAKEAEEASVRAAVARIAQLHGQLRNVHLSAHLEQTEVLTPGQIALYGELRGYGKPQKHEHHRRDHGGPKPTQGDGAAHDGH